MRKREIAAIFVVALLAVAGTSMAISGSGHGVVNAHVEGKHALIQDFTLVEHDDHTTDTGTATKAGDVEVFTNSVYDAQDSKQVGTDNGFCVLLDPSTNVYHCLYTINSAQGAITVSGTDDSRKTLQPNVDAIIGGTGQYSGAAGTLSITKTATEETLTFHFTSSAP